MKQTKPAGSPAAVREAVTLNRKLGDPTTLK